MASSSSYRKIKEAFDTEAQNPRGMFTKHLTEADKAIIKYLGEIVEPDWKVLEVGCGMGNVIENLRCQRWGLDISEEMIKRAFIGNKYVGNMDEMPFKDNEFDLVFMCFVLQQSLNPEETLRESERVGERVIVFDGDKDSSIGQERERKMKTGELETCGDAKWFTKEFFKKLGYEADNLLPHILVAKK